MGICIGIWSLGNWNNTELSFRCWRGRDDTFVISDFFWGAFIYMGFLWKPLFEEKASHYCVMLLLSWTLFNVYFIEFSYFSVFPSNLCSGIWCSLTSFEFNHYRSSSLRKKNKFLCITWNGNVLRVWSGHYVLRVAFRNNDMENVIICTFIGLSSDDYYYDPDKNSQKGDQG